MSSGQKVAFSFLSALIFLAAFVFFGQTSLMTKIETKFYAQAKIQEKTEHIEKITQSSNSYISNILAKVKTDEDAYLKDSSIKSYISQNPSEKDELNRRNRTYKLLDELNGLEGLRLIENNGRNIHYSSFEEDTLSKKGTIKQYKTYTQIQNENDEIEISNLLITSSSVDYKIYLDKVNNRIVISFPFYITQNTIFGTLFCYFNLHDYTQTLINDGVLFFGENISIVESNKSLSGLVLNLPTDRQNEFYQPVINYWTKNTTELEQILQIDDNNFFMMLGSKDNTFLKFGAIYKTADFKLPVEYIYLIYISSFISVFLIILLILSFKRDYITVIRSRIKKVQMGIINEYLDNKETIEWGKIAEQLQGRKNELSEEIKKSIGAKSTKYSKEIDKYLDLSWAEIISVISSQNENNNTSLNGASIAEIRKVIEEVLQTAKINVSNVSQGVQVVSDVTQVQVVDNVEEIEDAEAVEEIEEIDDGEAVEEIEEIDDAEAVEKIEEIDVDDAEVVEEIEEIDDTEVVEETAGIEELADVEQSVSDDETDEFDTVTEIDANIEDLEELEAYNEEEYTPPKEYAAQKEIDFYNNRSEYDEECFIGNDNTLIQIPFNKNEYEFTVSKPVFIPYETKIPVSNGEDLIEDLVPAEDMFYSMTEFGKNSVPVSELEGENPDSIIEKHGLYSISKDLEYSHVQMNSNFKELVDSVLNPVKH